MATKNQKPKTWPALRSKRKRRGPGIASHVFQVEGGDLATPGYHLRSVDTRKPRDRNDSPMWVNKTKEHTEVDCEMEVM